MNLKKNDLIESIKNLNKKKPLKEDAEIQRVLPPADADAQEQHAEAQRQNAKRRDLANYAQEVKELIEETASEESRYRHFDVVDRKELARRINEAKEKGLEFKVCKSNKAGFKYDFKVLKEEFIKKEAGDPDINTAAFNKATTVGASSPATGLGEEYKPSVVISGKELAYDLANWISDHEGDVVEDVKRYLDNLGYQQEVIEDLFDTGDFILEGKQEDVCPACGKNPCECEKEDIEEELKIYTSKLDNFHPSERAEDFWNEIKEADKLEDLEYALESLYPDGIGDVALDDMLCYEEDWIRDLIDLPLEDKEEIDNDVNKEEVVDEFDDEDVEPVDDLELEDEEDIEPIYGDEEEDSEDLKEARKKKTKRYPLGKGEHLNTCAGDPSKNTEFFNHVSAPDASSPSTGIGESLDEENIEYVKLIEWEEAVKDSYNHFVSDLGRIPSASEVLEDVLNNYNLNVDIEIDLDDPIKYGKWVSQVEQILNKEKLEFEDEETGLLENKSTFEDKKEKDELDDKIAQLGESFVKTQFKPNDLNEAVEQESNNISSEVKKSLTDSDEEEVVAVDDALVEDMLGLPKSEESKKE